MSLRGRRRGGGECSRADKLETREGRRLGCCDLPNDWRLEDDGGIQCPPRRNRKARALARVRTRAQRHIVHLHTQTHKHTHTHTHTNTHTHTTTTHARAPTRARAVEPFSNGQTSQVIRFMSPWTRRPLGHLGALRVENTKCAIPAAGVGTWSAPLGALLRGRHRATEEEELQRAGPDPLEGFARAGIARSLVRLGARMPPPRDGCPGCVPVPVPVGPTT